MAYLTSTEFAAYIGTEVVSDGTFLDRCIDAAEDAVDDFCGRTFDVAGADSETRVFVPGRMVVYIDDIVDDTDLAITNDGAAVDLGDVQLEPVNNRSAGGLTVPYCQIRFLGGCWQRTYPGQASVSVTSTRWGWPAVPAKVKEATAIVAKDLAHMRDVRFGVMGFGEFAVARLRDNPSVVAMLDRLRHPRAFGIA